MDEVIRSLPELDRLAGKSVLHKTCVEKEDMAQFISDFLGV